MCFCQHALAIATFLKRTSTVHPGASRYHLVEPSYSAATGFGRQVRACVLCAPSAEAGMASWDAVVATAWWRWAGHLARLTESEPDRWGEIGTAWRGAWCRQTVRCMLHSTAGPGSLRLDRGHWLLGKRGWDEAIQKQSDETLTAIAAERERSRDSWKAIEKLFVE